MVKGFLCVLIGRAAFLFRECEDFEALPATTETWIRIAMIQLMVRRLAARA